jgi:predicted glycosyltransferase
MGLGHVRRHLAIVSALVRAVPEAKVLLTTSVDEVSRLGLPPGVDTLKLPGLHKVANGEYSSRRLGLPSSEICELRSALLRQTVESFRPAVVVVDKHPFGAGGEFRAALEAAKSLGAKAVLGLRDILDESVALRKEWSADRLHQRITDYYDMVLIYGAAAVFDPVEEYQFPPTLSKRTRYCGYVLNHTDRTGARQAGPSMSGSDPRAHPLVLGTTGGGEDGFALLQTFIRAAKGAPWRGLAVTGPMLGQEEVKRLQQMAADSGVSLRTFVPCLPDLFGSANGLVCMGGYNTLVEAASQGVPTVCVPRNSPRAEQLVRARAFERLGLLRCIHPDQLTVEQLRAEVAAALQIPRQEMIGRAQAALTFDGAHRAANHLVGLMRSVRRTPQGRLEPAPA